MAGLRRGRFRQGRADPAGPRHRRPRPARRRVVKGAPLFDQDDTDDRAAVDQADAAGAAGQGPARQSAGTPPSRPRSPRPRPISTTRRRRATRCKPTCSAIEALLKSGAATAQIVDQEQADLALGRGEDRRRRGGAGAGPGAARPAAARSSPQTSAVEAADAALAQARWRLDQRSVASPVAGVVADVLARPGETLAGRARRSSRCCRRRTSSSVSSCPSRRWPHVHRRRHGGADLRQLPGRSDRHRLVHLAAGRIHAAVHLLRNDAAPSSSFSPRRGRSRTRRRCSIPASRSRCGRRAGAAMNDYVIDVQRPAQELRRPQGGRGLSLQVAQAARSAAFSAPTAAARRRRSACCAACSPPTAARGPASATTSSARRTRSAARSAT